MGNQDVVVRMSAQSGDLMAKWKEAAGGVDEFNKQLKVAFDLAKKANVEAQGLKGTVSGLSPQGGGAQQLSTQIGKSQQSAQQLNSQLINVKQSLLQTIPGASQLGQQLNIANIAGRAFQVVLQGIKADLENFRERGKSAAGFQVDVAQAQREAYRALQLGPGGMKPADFDARIQAMQRSTHASLGSLYQGAASSLSSRGRLSEGEALDTEEMVAKIDPSLSGGDIGDTVGATNDIRKAFGGSSKQAIGYMLAGMRTSRVTNIHDFSQNAVPGIFGMEKMGLNAKESASLFAAIGQESADPTGSVTTTGSLNFTKKLMESTAGIKALQGKSFEERLAWLQSGDKQATGMRHTLQGSLSEEARMEGLSGKPGMTGRVRTIEAQIEMLDPKSKTFEAYLNAKRQMPDYSDAGSFYDANIDAQQGSSIQRTARANETARTQKEQNLMDPRDAQASLVRDMIVSDQQKLGNYGRQIGPQFLIPAATPGIGRNAQELMMYDAQTDWTDQDPAHVGAKLMQGRRDAAKLGGPLTFDPAKDAQMERMIDAMEGMRQDLNGTIKVEDTGARSRSDSAPRSAPLNNLRDPN